MKSTRIYWVALTLTVFVLISLTIASESGDLSAGLRKKRRTTTPKPVGGSVQVGKPGGVGQGFLPQNNEQAGEGEMTTTTG